MANVKRGREIKISIKRGEGRTNVKRRGEMKKSTCKVRESWRVKERTYVLI